VPLRTWGLDDVWSQPTRLSDPTPTHPPFEEDQMFEPDIGELSGTYELDRAHTRIGFVARQLAGAPVRGSFHTFAGGGRFRAADPASATAEVSIDAATVSTGNGRRDRHLVSAAFFDVEQNPRITFRSTAVEPLDGAGARLSGDLTVAGRTEPVTIQVTCTEAVTEPGGRTSARFEGRGTVSRKAFGLGWGGPLVRDAVAVELDLAVGVTRARAMSRTTPREA
jgi:polyisoprenoid-binding protein YceI